MIDLANQLIRETYRKKGMLRRSTTRDMDSLRRTLAEAKRFVLDERMSEFAAELATVPFDAARMRQHDVLTSMRHSAIPPFSQMFIQLDNHAFRKGLLRMGRTRDFQGSPLLNPLDAPHTGPKPGDDIVKDAGWLIETDRDDVKVSEFFYADMQGLGDRTAYELACLPFYFLYSLTDKGYVDGPYRGGVLDTKSAAIAHGISFVRDNRMAVVYDRDLKFCGPREKNVVHDEVHGDSYIVHTMLTEFGGILRYVMCFLATLSDIPTIKTDSRPQKGYLGGGQIRKYMDYTTLTLKLPAKTTSLRLAQRLIAKARRGWHEVIPHAALTVFDMNQLREALEPLANLHGMIEEDEGPDTALFFQHDGYTITYGDIRRAHEIIELAGKGSR